MKANDSKEIITTLVHFQEQIRILHWQTSEYARHMAYGRTYDALTDLIDSYVEVCIGKHGRPDLKGPITLQNGWEMDAKEFTDKFVEFLIGITDKVDGKEDTDLLNIRDEILHVANQLKYLLSLK